ncbi:hypothetical protein DRP07_02195 [Archaeoglobales archaeon]|nr:MAG: hypothetical protein DRP07_02195 [Archaeoglobales archaeon]
MTTILWLSRHEPLPAQVSALRRKFGEVKIVKYQRPLSTAADAIHLAKECGAEYIIPVLPLSFIAYLVDQASKEGIKIIMAKMKSIHECYQQPCPQFMEDYDTIIESRDYNSGIKIYRHYRFEKFCILEGIKFIERDL